MNKPNIILIISTIILIIGIVIGMLGVSQCPLSRIEAEDIKCIEPPAYYYISFGMVVMSLILLVTYAFIRVEGVDD